jgi:hypothetical protein
MDPNRIKSAAQHDREEAEKLAPKSAEDAAAADREEAETIGPDAPYHRDQRTGRDTGWRLPRRELTGDARQLVTEDGEVVDLFDGSGAYSVTERQNLEHARRLADETSPSSNFAFSALSRVSR